MQQSASTMALSSNNMSQLTQETIPGFVSFRTQDTVGLKFDGKIDKMEEQVDEDEEGEVETIATSLLSAMRVDFEKRMKNMMERLQSADKDRAQLQEAQIKIRDLRDEIEQLKKKIQRDNKRIAAYKKRIHEHSQVDLKVDIPPDSDSDSETEF